MKRIALVRHAQAESALPGHSDFDRLLTRRGHEDAAEMARRLRLIKFEPQQIVSSTAPRAYATAENFARVLKLKNPIERDDRLYTAGPNEFFNVVVELDKSIDHVILIAHNPGITEFADKLSSERRIESMPTCSVVTMRFAIVEWSDLAWHVGTDVQFNYPAQGA